MLRREVWSRIYLSSLRNRQPYSPFDLKVSTFTSGGQQISMTSVIQCVVLSSSSPGKPVNPQSISWPLKFSPKKYIQLGVCPHFPQDVFNWNMCNHFLIVVQIFPFSLKSKFSFCANAQVFHGVLTLSCSHKLCVNLSVSPHSSNSCYLFLIAVNLAGMKLHLSVT